MSIHEQNLTRLDAHAAFMAAEEAWAAAIKSEFPGEWHGDVRYEGRAKGKPGSALRAAYEKREQARVAWSRFATAFPGGCPRLGSG